MIIDEFIGRQIKDFIIEERIGRGGMATVYRARQPAVNRQVALKIIRLEGDAERDEFRQRFAQEAEVIAKLEHIHILPIYDYGIQGDIAYIAMRLLRGGTLADILHEGPMELHRAGELFGQFARALAYAHSKGIIHRDLKPSNIMLDDSGNSYLTDFGLAKLVEGSSGITKSGNIVGTPAYMSPEQLRGDDIDRRADIYSLGIILYHMVVGYPPFQVSTSNDIISIIYKHLEKEPTPPRQINPHVPEAVEAIILQALRKNPADRFDNVLQMANELDAALGRKVSTSQYPAVVTSTKLPAFDGRAPRATRVKIRPVYAGVAALLLLILLLAGLLVVQNNNFLSILGATPTRFGIQPPTVIPGKVGSAAIVPTGDEVESASAILGDDSFIAYIACTQESEYHTTQAREMRDFAADYGLDLRIYDSEEDTYRQITQIEKARIDGAKALIICPLDPNLIQNAVESARDAGILILPIHSELEYYQPIHLEGDNYLIGFKPGVYAGELAQRELNGQANVVILDYPTVPSIVERANGLEAGIKQAIPDANIIGRFLGATPENGENSVRELIEDGLDFNVVLSINDAGAFGAIKALEEADIDPASVIITSVDAEVLAQQYIREDYYMRGSVEVGRERMSRTVVDLIVKMLAGSTLPDTVILEPGDLVTKEVLENMS
jgi:serine/threonine protein kinase/ABC-type sugar transport system substrate-binding protein